MPRSRAVLWVFLAAALFAGCAKKPNDAQLAANIKAQMFSDPQTKDAGLQVAVKDGVVTLSGAVPSDAARYDAFKIATNTPGVVKVNDQMTVQPAQVAEATPATVPAPAPERKPKPARRVRRVRRIRRVRRTTRRVAQAEPAPEPTPAPAPAPAPAPQPAAAPAPAPPPPPQPVNVEIASGTTIEIQTVDPVDSKVNHAGQEFQATLAQPLVSGSQVIVPAGANVVMRLVNASSAGHYTGRSELRLELTGLQFQGRQYPLVTGTYQLAGGSRGKNTAEKVGAGAVIGTLIGAIAGGGKGAAIGAGVGAAGGGVYQGATHGKQVRIPAETKLDFRLEQPLDITYTPPSDNNQ